MRVLDRAEAEIQDIGRGRRVFPFNRVRVHVIAAPGDKESRARFAAVIDGPPSLSERLAERLAASAAARCNDRDERGVRHGAAVRTGRTRISTSSSTASTTRAGRDRRRRLARSRPSIRLKLAVVKGAADQRGYAFSSGRIDIGRDSDVVDQRQRLIRTNHVAFSEDGADANRTRLAPARPHRVQRAGSLLSDLGRSQRLTARASSATDARSEVPAGARGTQAGIRRRDRARPRAPAGDAGNEERLNCHRSDRRDFRYPSRPSPVQARGARDPRSPW